MSTPESVQPPQFDSLYGLLSHVALSAAGLEREAVDSLYQRENPAGYREALINRAKLITTLPGLLISFKEGGGEVPEEVERFAITFAGIATEALEVDMSGFMLRSVLNPLPGGSKDDPNELEKLAASYAPPTTQ